jgi:predicted nucleic acid-binding Zn ribbon protein
MFSGQCMSCGVAIDRHGRLCAERCRETRSHRGEQNGFAKLTTQYVLALGLKQALRLRSASDTAFTTD